MTESVSTPVASAAAPPAVVRRAVWLLWGSWGIGQVLGFLMAGDPQFVADIMQRLQEASAMNPNMMTALGDETVNFEDLIRMMLYVTLAVGTVLSFGVVAFVLAKLKRGRDWARILCAIFGGLKLLQLLQLPGGLYTLLQLLHMGLGYGALYLLFTAPGKEWFAPRPAANSKTDENW